MIIMIIMIIYLFSPRIKNKYLIAKAINNNFDSTKIL